MKILVLGGGIGGLCTAIALESEGFEVELFESAERFSPVGAGLALSPNALNALEELGMKEAVMEKALSYTVGLIKQTNGKIISTMRMDKITAQTGGEFVSIHRHDLHHILAAKLKNCKLHFNKRCKSINTHNNKTELIFTDGSSAQCDYLIAADGIHSAVRKHFLPTAIERYSGQTCWRGVCSTDEISIAGVTEYWGKGKRFGMLPLKDKRVYWFAVLDAPQNSDWRNAGKKKILELYTEFGNHITEIISHTDEQHIFWSDLSDLPPIRKFAFGNVLLLGDAAHATTPNLGQGACMAIEDAAMLKLLFQKEKNLDLVFRIFEKNRINRTRKIVNLSYKIGQMAQSRNSLLVWLRNNLFGKIPFWINAPMYRSIFGYRVKNHLS